MKFELYMMDSLWADRLGPAYQFTKQAYRMNFYIFKFYGQVRILFQFQVTIISGQIYGK